MVAPRGSRGAARNLAAADGRISSIEAQIRALTEKLEAAREQRVDIIGEAALTAFPELTDATYGEDLVEFFVQLREDALLWREQASAGGASAKAAGKDDDTTDVAGLADDASDEEDGNLFA